MLLLYLHSPGVGLYLYLGQEANLAKQGQSLQQRMLEANEQSEGKWVKGRVASAEDVVHAWGFILAYWIVSNPNNAGSSCEMTVLRSTHAWNNRFISLPAQMASSFFYCIFVDGASCYYLITYYGWCRFWLSNCGWWNVHDLQCERGKKRVYSRYKSTQLRTDNLSNLIKNTNIWTYLSQDRRSERGAPSCFSLTWRAPYRTLKRLWPNTKVSNW